jgi:ATP-dependent Clp protease ATP-binding subunit ClpC
VFHSLTKDQVRGIVDLMTAIIIKTLAEQSIKLEITDAAKNYLGEKGYDPNYGARPLRRVIQDEVEDKLSESLLHCDFKSGDTVEIDYDGEKITIRPATSSLIGDETTPPAAKEETSSSRKSS